MSALYVIPCSGAKLPHPAPAGELYVGSWHRLARQAADQLAARDGGRVLILSALHGLLELGQLVAPYDVTIRQLEARSGPGSLGLSRKVGGQLAQLAPARVVGLVPGAYAEVLAAAVITASLQLGQLHAIEWQAPLAGCSGVGYQRQRLAAMRDGQNLLAATC